MRQDITSLGNINTVSSRLSLHRSFPLLHLWLVPSSSLPLFLLWSFALFFFFLTPIVSGGEYFRWQSGFQITPFWLPLSSHGLVCISVSHTVWLVKKTVTTHKSHFYQLTRARAEQRPWAKSYQIFFRCPLRSYQFKKEIPNSPCYLI